MKVCSKCGKERAEEDFAYKNKEKEKRNTHCKICKREYGQEHYRKNRAIYIKRAKEHTKKIRILTRNYLRAAKNKPCADCGMSYPYYVMDFDHRYDKKYSIALMPGRAYGLEVIKEEISKCDVVCANCHRIRTYGKRSAN